MNIRKRFLLIILLFTGLIYFSCDDSGVQPPSLTPGIITLTQTSFKPLDTGVDGLYQLWLFVTDSLGSRYKSVGKFNVLANGNIVDASGQPVSFSLGADTANLPAIKSALITIEAPGQNNTFPGSTHMLAGPITLYTDSLSGSLVIGDTNALGATGTFLQGSLGAHYLLHVTTQAGLDCHKGLWYADTLANPLLPAEMNLAAGGGWIYESWVVNNATNEYISMGRFLVNNAPDNDGAGPCRGPDPAIFNTPGQEWVIDSCSSISRLNDGNHGVFITLEPSFRTGTTPFFLKVYIQGLISTTLSCFTYDNIFGLGGTFPKAKIKITRRR
jgi:hypothetical protein